MSRSAVESDLDDICVGVAADIFCADQARRLLEELNVSIEAINRTGIGLQFFAGLQMILQHELILSITRVYEPYSSRNPGRALAAATHHITTYAAGLRVLNRECLIEFLTSRDESPRAINEFSDKQLSLTLARGLRTHLPRANSKATSPLDQALGHLKEVRDKAIAHHDRVRHSSLLVPGWSHLVDLINTASEIVNLVSRAYLSVGRNIANDAILVAQSLRELLDRAGLSQNPDPHESKTV